MNYPDIPDFIPIGDALDEWIDADADPSIELAWRVWKQSLEAGGLPLDCPACNGAGIVDTDDDDPFDGPAVCKTCRGYGAVPPTAAAARPAGVRQY